MYAFLKHIRTAIKDMENPFQVAGYKDFEDMKKSGHYDDLMKSFKESIVNSKTIPELRENVRDLFKNDQLRRLTELEYRTDTKKGIQKTSLAIDKIIRQADDLLLMKNPENNKIYKDFRDMGIYIWVEKFNARYKVRLRSDMDSRNVMNHIPRTLQTHSWRDVANKYITLQLPVYYVEIIIRQPVIDCSRGSHRQDSDLNTSFKVPLPFNYHFGAIFEIGKYIPQLLLRDYAELSKTKDIQSLLKYIQKVVTDKNSTNDSAIMEEDQHEDDNLSTGNISWTKYAGLLSRYRTNSYTRTPLFLGVTKDIPSIFTKETWNGYNPPGQTVEWSRQYLNGDEVDSMGYERKIHPFISSIRNNHPCWAGWTDDLKESMLSLDVRKLALTLKGWVTIYNNASAPHHNIQYFMIGLPKSAAQLGHSQYRQGNQCFRIFNDKNVCDTIECVLRNECEPYMNSIKNTIYDEEMMNQGQGSGDDEIDHHKLIKTLPNTVTVGNTTVRLLSEEEKRRLLNEI